MRIHRGNVSKPMLDQRGTTAVEFAIIAPAMIMLVVGITSLSLMLFAFGSMHFAVEDAARCASVRPTQCNNGSATVAYAQSRYFGALATPIFTHSAVACGNRVNATATFNFDIGVFQQAVPISATSCFPS